MSVIPFYGATDPGLFAIERAAMDRAGLVTTALDGLLAEGRCLDIGAGDGTTAGCLAGDRQVTALEPAAEMIDVSARGLDWVIGDAEALPFADGSFDGVYSTWAYFFPGYQMIDIDRGLMEVQRVLRPGGVFAMVDNLGDDEFTSLSGDPASICTDIDWWLDRGFTCQVVNSHFEFESLTDARRLLGAFFGAGGAAVARMSFTFRIGLFHRSW